MDDRTWIDNLRKAIAGLSHESGDDIELPSPEAILAYLEGSADLQQRKAVQAAIARSSSFAHALLSLEDDLQSSRTLRPPTRARERRRWWIPAFAAAVSLCVVSALVWWIRRPSESEWVLIAAQSRSLGRLDDSICKSWDGRNRLFLGSAAYVGRAGPVSQSPPIALVLDRDGKLLAKVEVTDWDPSTPPTVPTASVAIPDSLLGDRSLTTLSIVVKQDPEPPDEWPIAECTIVRIGS